MKSFQRPFLLLLAAVAIVPHASFAMDQIIRPSLSVRSSGMGSLRITTGLYEENFFGNPARATANPKWRVTVLDPSFEFKSNVADDIGSFSGGSDLYGKLGANAGTNYHERVQTTMPAVYIPPVEDGKWSFAFALMTSLQSDRNIRRNYAIDASAYADVGPAITVARKLLDGDALSVGATAHFAYRLAFNPDFGFVDVLKGSALSPSGFGGQGASLDFDLGGTFNLPEDVLGWKIQTGLALNNLLGGNYTIGLRPISSFAGTPPAQPRALGFGAAARTPELWIFTDTLVALEFTDIGNNGSGGFFRTVHLGGETHYSVFAFRLGLNQGYFAAGLGVDLNVFQLDLSTYGEEMGLNAGAFEDRRFGAHIAFQI